jgi:hypothetical protein
MLPTIANEQRKMKMNEAERISQKTPTEKKNSNYLISTFFTTGGVTFIGAASLRAKAGGHPIRDEIDFGTNRPNILWDI